MITIETATVRSPCRRARALRARRRAVSGSLRRSRRAPARAPGGALRRRRRVRARPRSRRRRHAPPPLSRRRARRARRHRRRPRRHAFQARVWKALRKIPVGATWSYAALARKVGSPEAVRAVGAANGPQPGVAGGAVPPRHRRGRHAVRLWRRHRAQALAPHPRARAARLAAISDVTFFVCRCAPGLCSFEGWRGDATARSVDLHGRSAADPVGHGRPGYALERALVRAPVASSRSRSCSPPLSPRSGRRRWCRCRHRRRLRDHVGGVPALPRADDHVGAAPRDRRRARPRSPSGSVRSCARTPRWWRAAAPSAACASATCSLSLRIVRQLAAARERGPRARAQRARARLIVPVSFL